MLDHIYPKVSEKWFKEYNWFDFYQDTKEDPPLNMLESRVHEGIVMCFIDINHYGKYKYGRNQTGALIFINRFPINCYRKQKTAAEARSFGMECCTIKAKVEMV